MSKHWRPKRSGLAGQWDRHRWPMPANAHGGRGRGSPAGGGILAMVLGGLLVGSLYAVGTSATIAWPLGFGTGQGSPRDLHVIDGDTFDLGGTRIRIADIDTPEIRGRCAYETRLAARATTRMRALLGEGPFELHRTGTRDEDRYGRKLRIVTRGGHSLGDVLVAEGLARTWSGRREPWC